MFNTYTRLEKKSRSVGSGPVVNFLHYNKFSITAPLHGLSPEVGLLNSFQGRSRFSQGFWIGTVFRTLDLFGFSFGFGSVRFFSDLDFNSSIATQRCSCFCASAKMEKCYSDLSVVNLNSHTPKHL